MDAPRSLWPDIPKKATHAAEQDRPHVLKRLEAWFQGHPERLIFIDGTWTSTNMARLWGRVPKGERLRAGILYGHWKTTTFVPGLKLSGMVAPIVLDGPINAEVFQAALLGGEPTIED